MQEKEYKDAKGKTYEIGDIVFNPCFGDYWLVGKYSDNKTISKYEDECPYYLAQYGDPDLYFMDLDEPYGFEIEVKKGSERYENALKEIQEIAKFYKKADEEEDNGKVENTCKG